MKNYELEKAINGLSNKGKFIVKSTKIAILTGDVHRKLKSGLARKLAEIKATLKDAAVDAAQARDEYNANKIVNINETIAQKEEQIAEIKSNANLSDKEKNYIIKAYESDVERLRNKTNRVAAAPRRLLISLMFIQKLIANRKKAKVNIAQVFYDKIPSVNGTQTINEAQAEVPNYENNIVPQTQVVQENTNNVVTPEPTVQPNTGSVEINLAQNQTLDLAIAKYIEINNRRKDLEEKIQKEQDELSICKASLDRLVQEYGLTKEMVEQRVIRK